MRNQAAHEHEMARLGQQRFIRIQGKAKEKGLETTTKAGSRLLANSVQYLEEGITEWVRKAKTSPGVRHRAVEYLDRLPADVVAALTCKVVLNSVSLERTFTQVARACANRVADEALHRWLQQEHPVHWGFLKDRLMRYSSYAKKRKHVITMTNRRPDIDWTPWPQMEKIAMGSVLVELMAQTTGLVEVVTRSFRRGQTQLMVTPTADTLKWLEQANENYAELEALHLPCVSQPDDWSGPLDGGFLTAELRRSALVKTNSTKVLDELESAEMPVVYSSVNALQHTPWMVNDPVLKVLNHFWNASLYAVGLPPREDEPIPPKPADIATNEEARLAWRRRAGAVHDSNLGSRAMRLAMSQIVNMANRFSGRPFWFVYQLDWRGRAYPVSYHLHPQGTDLSKSLLQFEKGATINTPEAWDWHRVHGANCWGVDKLSFAERIKWVMIHETMVLEVARDPLACRMWQDADEPWQFLAWCFDYAACQADEDHVSCLPIHQDATQSGIQIMSLMLRDKPGAAATNCTPSEAPQDLYDTVAKQCAALLQKDGSPMALGWLEFGIDRKCCKRPVMTRVYNATKISCSEYVRDWARDKEESTGTKVPKGPKPYWFLACKVWEAMTTVLEGTAQCQNWMRAAAEVMVEHNLVIRWTSPLGLPIRQRYPKWNSKCVRTAVGEVIRQNRVRIERHTMDRRKMGNALAPNFVHSLDAAAMMLTIHKAKEAGLVSFAAVHDSFATTASGSVALASCIREAYVEVFKPDVLALFKTELEAYLPEGVELPALPTYGDLDVEVVRNSPYFFS